MLERMGINGGVLVREVVPESVAASAGILPGDVITLIGSSPIKSPEAFSAAVEQTARQQFGAPALDSSWRAHVHWSQAQRLSCVNRTRLPGSGKRASHGG